MNLPPVLLTSSAIAMDRSVALKDTERRIHYTVESIEKWMNVSPGLRLVICDGSDYDFSAILKARFPERKIEFLHFMNDPEQIALHGKGYGEGEIIRYALRKSVLLQESEWFAKCTAKLWVDNFPDCVAQWNGSFLCKAFFSSVFSLRPTRFEYIDTRFYLAERDFYETYFGGAHLEVGGISDISIEVSFKRIVLEHQLQHILFRTPPVIRGVGGASGKYYRNNLIRQLKETLRSKIVQSTSSYNSLFSQAG